MAINKLQADLRLKNFKGAYLLAGEEAFLMRHYEKLLLDNISENLHEVEYFENDFNIHDFLLAAATPPLFSSRRLLVVRHSGLFVAGKKNDSDLLADFLKDIPPSTTIIFSEEKTDKRLGVYKAITKHGHLVPCQAASENERMGWLKDFFKPLGKTINNQDLIFFVRFVGGTMENIATEAEKLWMFLGDEKHVTQEHIETACIQSLESHVFDLVDAIGSHNQEKSFILYHTLIAKKESPIGILSMIGRQFKNILLCDYLEKKSYTRQHIAKALSLPPFVVQKYIAQSKTFKNTQSMLKHYKACLAADLSIKTGKQPDVLAVEMLILKDLG